MELISLNFALVLVAILCAYYLIGRFFPRAQWMVLLLGSIAFYGVAGGWQLLVYMLLVAFVTWGTALLLNRLEQQSKAARKAIKDRAQKKLVRQRYARRKRILFWAAIAICLCVLGYFKYWNVFLYYLGSAESIHSLGIVLPLGISFYTLQAVSYLIDSYNAKYDPQHNFVRYLLFVSWFPQIIQGPINRYDQLAPQLLEPHSPDLMRMERGLLRLGLGILKKIAIANILCNAVTAVFNVAAGPSISCALAIFGVIAYSIQMYADFSGGIDIVEGASELFGIQMAQNFRQPYFSVSLADFWRRWHMSLGTWMRDYVFYPLAVTSPSRSFGKWAGKHFGKHAGRTFPACVANILVFLLVGLWHGAEVHYLVWGLYNGAVVAISDLLSPTFDKLVERLHIRREAPWFHAFSMVRTFVVVCIGRFFDRFDHVADALYALRNIGTGFNPLPLKDVLAANSAIYADVWGFPVPTVLACVFILVVDIQYERGIDVRSSILSWHFPARLALYAFVAVVIAAGASLDATNGGGGFLYANF